MSFQIETCRGQSSIAVVDLVFHTSTQDFRALRSKKIRDYFPISQDVEIGRDPFDLRHEKKQLDRFYLDFERLVDQRISVQGLTKSRSFRSWWRDHREEFLTRPVIERFTAAQFTLSDFLDEAHLHFLESTSRQREASLFVKGLRRAVKSRLLLTLLLPIAVLLPRLGTFVWSLIVLGPGVQMVNSYTQPVITPLAQTAAQKGALDFATVSLSIQSWITNRGKLREIASELHATTAKLKAQNFGKLSAAQAQRKWAQFERVYYQLFLSYNQTLPSHLRDGRSFFRDWMVFTPIGLATNLSTFSIQYWTHRNALESARVLSPALKRMHQAEMSAAEERIAGTLAAWKLFEFMFPDFPQQQGLHSTYVTFVRSMRFDLYVKQFSSQMEKVLASVDADFLSEDRVATALSR